MRGSRAKRERSVFAPNPGRKHKGADKDAVKQAAAEREQRRTVLRKRLGQMVDKTRRSMDDGE
jgi:hypothetical protein